MKRDDVQVDRNVSLGLPCEAALDWPLLRPLRVIHWDGMPANILVLVIAASNVRRISLTRAPAALHLTPAARHAVRYTVWRLAAESRSAP